MVLPVSVDCARGLAESLLAASVPKRWLHSIGVAEAARRIAPILGSHAQTVEAAAWLHDIGYSPDVIRSGLHAIDGARYLRDTVACSSEVCALVAHHSGAEVEAELRGMPTIRAEFAPPSRLLLDALTYSDMTTSPAGTRIGVDQRLAEILRRYNTGHVVHASVSRSSPALKASVARIEHLLQE